MNPSQWSALDNVNDQAKVGNVFAEYFLPRLHQISQQTKTEAQMVPFLKTGQAALKAGLDLLESDQQRKVYQKLCQHHLREELGRLSVRAAKQNQQDWHRMNAKLVDAQLSDVKRWPEDERHFNTCIQNGLWALEAYHRQMGSAEVILEAAQAKFLSDLLIARLQALAPINIAYAAEVYNRHRNWLIPSIKSQIQGYLNRMEQVVRAGLLADAITQSGPKESWLDKVPAVAAHENDNNAAFRALLLDAVQARLDEAETQAFTQNQTDSNALLTACLTQEATKLETFLAQNPELALAWDRADPQTQTGLLDLMHIHRLGPRFTPDDTDTPIWNLAIGQALKGKSQIYLTNLAAPQWNPLPADQRLFLIELQNHRYDPVMQAELAKNAAMTRRLCQNEASPSRNCYRLMNDPAMP